MNDDIRKSVAEKVLSEDNARVDQSILALAHSIGNDARDERQLYEIVSERTPVFRRGKKAN